MIHKEPTTRCNSPNQGQGFRVFYCCGILAVACAVLGTVATAAGGDATPVLAADTDGNGFEDLLDRWRGGEASWQELRDAAHSTGTGRNGPEPEWPDKAVQPVTGPWARGNLRLVCLRQSAAELAIPRATTEATGGTCRVLHDIAWFGGVTVLEVDASGLRILMDHGVAGQVFLDRDGQPALDQSRVLVGAELARSGPWRVTGDWAASVAILDSGCDTAHDDLGDFSSDNIDGPPPAVGHALDWFSAAAG